MRKSDAEFVFPLFFLHLHKKKSSEEVVLVEKSFENQGKIKERSVTEKGRGFKDRGRTDKGQIRNGERTG